MRYLPEVLATEVVMTILIAFVLNYILKKRGDFSFKNSVVVILVLVMMASMLNSLTYYLVTPHNFLNTIVAVNLSMMSMTIAVVLIFWNAVNQEFGGLSPRLISIFVLLFIWNEISMGIFLYSLAFGSRYGDFPTNPLIGLLYWFSYGVNSYLFVAPMAAEMVILLFLVKPSGVHRNILLSILFMAVFSPTLAGNGYFVRDGTLLTTAFMVIFMIILYEFIAKSRNSIRGGEMKTLSVLFLVYMLMMFGMFFGVIFSKPFALSWLIYAVGMIVGMAFYFHNSLNMNFREQGKKIGWVKKPTFLFVVLLASFIAEWFAAGAISFEFSGASSVGGFQNFITFSDVLGGVNHFNPLSIVVDVFYLLGAVANSYWFLIIMGVEMGTLVIFQMRKVQWREKRVNLSLALAAFAVYTIFGPNFVNPALYNNLPLWANVGALDPLYPVLLVPIILSYVLYAGLAVLFGRRSYCGTLCPSAVMYGGTLGQSMISYNYEGKISRKNIGSKYGKIIYPVILNLWIILVIVSVLSYYTSANKLNATLYGIDPSVFYSFFVWNFLWYIFFISIPFVGMSPCRRYGWCTTGTFVGFFSKLGFFKLKVQDPQTCVTCKTKDCVTACEVGLGDLPGQFIKQGYFKSSKCVGSGSCVSACPYDNIYFYDVRNFLKQRTKSKKGN